MGEIEFVKPEIEARLQKRYSMLVKSHLHSAKELCAGVKSLPGIGSSFAATQGAWRFFSNSRVSLSDLVKPLREVACQRIASGQGAFNLLVHDWCKLSYRHGNKQDLLQVTHARDIGYDLTSALLVSAADGSPLAPMEMHLKTSQGTWSTRGSVEAEVSHLEQILPTMEASKDWGLSGEIVHVIDREADSVDYYRLWEEAGHQYLIRGDDRRVKWGGKKYLLSQIREQLKQAKKFCLVGEAFYKDKPADLWVAEAEVVLYRPARKNVKGKRFERAGAPLKLRCVFTEIRSKAGEVWAQWILLSNVDRALAKTEHLARCYYWRWRIESFFKLLKSHGHHLEQWQQEGGLSIAKRLLVAAMACVIVWQLQADKSKKAMEFKDVLVKLSGRQTRRASPHTAPALLDGLGKLLPMLALLEHYDLQLLKTSLSQSRFFNSG